MQKHWKDLKVLCKPFTTIYIITAMKLMLGSSVKGVCLIVSLDIPVLLSRERSP
jgi:hypothetical protein